MTTKKTILLVEDEAIVALNEKAILERADYSVEATSTGEAAVALMEHRTDIDLILMDIDLGTGIDGTQAAAAILLVRDLPIVFLTSHSEKDMVDRAKGITRYGYVLKSSGEFVLLESVAMAFELHAAHARHRAAEARYARIAEQSTDGADMVDGVSLTYASPDSRAGRFPDQVYRQVIDGSPILFGISRLDDGVYTEVNDQFVATTGYSRAELVGSSSADLGLIDAHLRKQLELELVETGRVHHAEVNLRTKDGGIRPCLLFVDLVDNRGDALVLTSAVDLTEQKAAEAAAGANDRALRAMFEFANVGMAVTKPDGTILRTNAEFQRMLGCEDHELVGRSVQEITLEEDWQVEVERTHAVMRGELDSVSFYKRYRRKDGSLAHARVHVYVIRDSESAVHTVFGIVETVAEFPRTQAADGDSHYLKTELYSLIQKDPAVFEFLQEGFLDGVWYWDLENRENEWLSPGFWELFGYDPKEMRHTPAEWQRLIFAEDRNVILECASAHIDDPRSPFEGVVRYRHKDGSTVWVQVRGLAVRDGRGKAIRFLGAHIDVTAIKRAEEDLRRHLDEKNDLMRELNHRVKNNLAMVSALITLKNQSLGDAADLSDISGQLNAILRLHERLSSEENGDAVDVSSYLREVVETAVGVYGGRVVQDLEVPALMLPSRTAITVGLLVNELATNAVKHGFDTTVVSKVSLVVTRQDDRISLEFANSGAPIPDEIDVKKPESMGLRLIHALVGQLGGDLEIQKAPEPRFAVQFPVPPPDGPAASYRHGDTK